MIFPLKKSAVTSCKCIGVLFEKILSQNVIDYTQTEQ